MANGPAPAGTIAAGSEAGAGVQEDTAQLIRALTATDPRDALRSWREWQNSVDIDKLPWQSMQIIPALAPSLWTWLSDDTAAGIFRGIVRRAWTEVQLRLSAVSSAVAICEGAGCSPVIIAGPAAVSLLNRRGGAVRPITILRLVVKRDQLYRASAALESAGWQLSGQLPAVRELDWANGVFYTQNEIGLLLHWRLLPVGGPLASAYEAEFLKQPQTVDCGGKSVLVPAPEHALLASLSARPDPDPDIVPWQVDAALLPLDTIDWSKWSALAAAYAPEAFDRLAEMRALGLDVPELARPPALKLPCIARPAIPLYTRLYRSMRRRARRVVRRCFA